MSENRGDLVLPALFFKMSFEDILGRIIIILLFFGGSLLFLMIGLDCLGIIKPKKINPEKWTKTNAVIKESKIIKKRPLGKYGQQFEYFVEFTIVYNVNNIEYKKYVRGLAENLSRISIYYKNKNPNYFKLESDVKRSMNIQKVPGIFSLFFSACIFISGCLIMSAIV